MFTRDELLAIWAALYSARADLSRGKTSPEIRKEIADLSALLVKVNRVKNHPGQN